MSIINDALKKVQNQLDEQNKPPAPPPAPAPEPIENPPHDEKPKPVIEDTKPFLKPVEQPSYPKKNVTQPKVSTNPLTKKNRTPQENKMIMACIVVAWLLVAAIVFVIKQYIEAKIDPFVDTTTIEQLDIQGVMTRDDRRVVLVENEIYEVGEYLEGFKIVDIDVAHVHFQTGKKITSIKIHKRAKPQPSTPKVIAVEAVGDKAFDLPIPDKVSTIKTKPLSRP